jgi:hypothetical protein
MVTPMVLKSRNDSPARRLRLVCLVLAALLACAFAAGPWLHALADRPFADTRAALGIANFGNVVSNLAFLAVGVLGLKLCRGTARPLPVLSWTVFYAGMVLTCCGSAWYHLHPSDAAIVWDRLGMTVAFVSLSVAILKECIPAYSLERALLPALLLGAASVLWWRASGDLRLYAWVQAAPLGCVALCVALGWVQGEERRAFVWSFALYLLSKAAEMSDAQIYAFTRHAISGHTLKHLLAASATGAILAMQWRRGARHAPTATGAPFG